MRPEVANFFQTTLSAIVSATATVFDVLSTGAFQGDTPGGILAVIEPLSPTQREVVRFRTVPSATRFEVADIADRYLDGSAAGAGIIHPADALVWVTPLAQHIDEIWDAIEAAQAVADAAVTQTQLNTATVVKRVRAATVAAGTLATAFENGDTIDGVVLATGDRVLIKDQAAPEENGIYVVAAAGAPTRATDWDVNAESLPSTLVAVSEGTSNKDSIWQLTTNAPVDLGVTGLSFSPVHMQGTGSPEGVVTAPVGARYVRLDGGTATTLYVKEAGTGNTGWAAAGSGASGGGGSGGASFCGVRATKSADQSINNATDTAVTFTVEDFDTDGFHDNVTNTSRFTVPAGRGGKFLISANVWFAANATGVRACYVYKNGAWLTTIDVDDGAVATDSMVVAGSVVVNLAAGDYIEIFASQTSGGALNVVSGSPRTAVSMVLLDTSIGTAGFVGARAYLSANQSLTSGTFTALNFAAETFDSNGFHDNVTNNTRFTVPAGKSGKYRVAGAAEFAANTAGTRAVMVYKNGAIAQYLFYGPPSPTAGLTVIIGGVADLDLVAGDYVEIFAYQTSGGALNVLSGSAATAASIVWLEGLQAQTAVKKNAVLVATRGGLDFKEGAGISLTVADDAANGEVDVTIDTRFCGARAHRVTSAQSIANNTITAVQLNAETLDSDAFHDNATNNTRFTVPAGKAGKYRALASVQFAGNATGVRQVEIRVNGTLLAYVRRPAGAANATVVTSSDILNLAVGDYVEAHAYQDSGGALDLDAVSYGTFLALEYIGT